jgi:hypothetical protein
MSWQQKPWGWTLPLCLSPTFELWSAHVLAGGFSSLHWHDLKTNRIACRDATLRIAMVIDGVEGYRTVGPGDLIDLPPGLMHRFEVLQSGRIWETYWGHCHPQDIVRVDANGWKPPGLIVPPASRPTPHHGSQTPRQPLCPQAVRSPAPHS